MPEGPELAYSRDVVKKHIEGMRIIDAGPETTGRYSKKSPDGWTDFSSLLQGSPARIVEVSTHGKFMWWKFSLENDAEPWFMWCTYGMSGGWFTSPSKHTAFTVRYNASGVPITRDTKRLFFNDPRHFGTLKFVRGQQTHNKKLKSLGPCVLTSQVTPDLFAEKMLRKPARTISEALMDQSSVAGVGNYIKAEALYRGGISPWRLVTDISSEEYMKLCKEVLDVAKETYESQGATISTYRTPDGSKGTTQFNFKVYSRNACPKGHAVVREETPEGRTSHWCKNCQK